MGSDGLHDRLIAAAEGKTDRSLSDLTGRTPRNSRTPPRKLLSG